MINRDKRPNKEPYGKEQRKNREKNPQLLESL
jgi:hypothetical protein